MTTKKIILSLIVLCFTTDISAQNTRLFTLEECYGLALKNSTLSQQSEIHSNIANSDVKDSKSAYVPSASILGSASYQSNVTHIALSIIEPPRKEQYKAYLDIEQLIYDGGYLNKRRGIIASTLKSEMTKLDISELELKQRVANLYLATILTDERLKLTELQISTLGVTLSNLKNLKQGGVAMKSDITIIETEILKQEQQLISFMADREKLIEMLSILVGEKVNSESEFITPNHSLENLSTQSERPEFALFETQKDILSNQIKLITTKSMPKFSLFANGGNGIPGLNMLSRNPDWYYIIGVKLSIPLTKWATTKHEKNTLFQRQMLVTQQQQDFIKNNNIQIIEALSEISKIEKVISKDDQIIEKSREIVNDQKEKLFRGVATSNDYVIELNSLQGALLSKNLNQIKLIQATINYKTVTGKL